MEKNNKKKGADLAERNGFPGYPIYPASEDIYNKEKEEENIDPEQLDKEKSSVKEPEKWNEKGFKKHKSGSDLDIPGAELDDAQEEIGSEDEENNGYSLGDTE